jgi:hypothetical protein
MDKVFRDCRMFYAVTSFRVKFLTIQKVPEIHAKKCQISDRLSVSMMIAFLATLTIFSISKTKNPSGIGIDLGTTFSCVGIFENGKVELIANNNGHRITPSLVSYQNSPPLVGEAALSRRITSPENTIFGIKRLMGLHFSDPKIQNDKNRVPYKVVERMAFRVLKFNTKVTRHFSHLKRFLLRFCCT